MPTQCPPAQPPRSAEADITQHLCGLRAAATSFRAHGDDPLALRPAARLLQQPGQWDVDGTGQVTGREFLRTAHIHHAHIGFVQQWPQVFRLQAFPLAGFSPFRRANFAVQFAHAGAIASSMSTIRIDRINIVDLEKLREVGMLTFRETFEGANTEADMERYLCDAFSSEKLAMELADKGSRFYFAQIDDVVVGYLKVNTGAAQTERMDHPSLEIERIYVLKDYHGKQVGQLLFDKAMAIARELEVDDVWLGVWEANPRAIGFYRKNGFDEFGKHVFKLGDDEQTDILMRKQLAKG